MLNLAEKMLNKQHLHSAFIRLQRLTLFWDIFRNFPQREKRFKIFERICGATIEPRGCETLWPSSVCC